MRGLAVIGLFVATLVPAPAAGAHTPRVAPETIRMNAQFQGDPARPVSWALGAKLDGSANLAPDEDRAVYYPTTADQIVRSNCNIRSYPPHSWVWDPDHPEDDWSLANPDGTALPSGAAYLEPGKPPISASGVSRVSQRAGNGCARRPVPT